MKRKPVEKMDRYEIIDALIEDGFEIDANDAADVLAAFGE